MSGHYGVDWDDAVRARIAKRPKAAGSGQPGTMRDAPWRFWRPVLYQLTYIIGAIAEVLGVGPAVLFGGEPSGITGERGEMLDRINALLASASDTEVKRAERVLAALFGG